MPAELEFDGERVVPGKTPIFLIWAHTARYQFVRDFVRAKSVLDLGCGEGYGTSYLAQHATLAVGVDIAPEAVAHARAHYVRPNLSYAVMDCSRLSFAERSFDIVCSFEVLEHIEPVDRFLGEVRRVLAPGGTFILSTPNKDSIPAGENPFHVKEYRLAEFKDILRRYFSSVEYYGQFTKRPIRRFLFINSTRLYLRSALYRRLLRGFAQFYFRGVRGEASSSDPDWVERVNPGNFIFHQSSLEQATNFVAVCHRS